MSKAAALPYAKYLGLPETDPTHRRTAPSNSPAKAEPAKPKTAAQRTLTSTPFADAIGEAPHAPVRSFGSSFQEQAARTPIEPEPHAAARIIAAGKLRRGERPESDSSASDAAAKRIIEAGKRRRGEI